MTETKKLGFTVVLGLSTSSVTVLEPGDIQQFYFIEDIFSYCMVGKMIFDDRFGINEYGPFTGNERLLLAYGETKSRRLIFDIIKVEKISMSSGTTSTNGSQVAIHFVDTTFKYMTKRKISKGWSNKNHLKIIQDIIKETEGDDENGKILLKRYDDPESISDFYIPYWTPMHSISWINKRTKPKLSNHKSEPVGGYLYYNNTYWDGSESKNKDNNFTAAWVNINNLFALPITSKSRFIDNNTFTFSGGPPGSNLNDNTTYVNKILDWEFYGIDNSNLKKLQGGKMLGYNFNGKNLLERTYKYTKKNDTEKVDIGMIDTITGLGRKSLFPDISQKNAEVILSGADNKNELDNIFYYNWLRSYSQQQNLAVVVQGWEERFAGMIIQDLYWKSFDSTNQGGNKNMIGPYLIKSVTHNWGTKDGYKQKLVLLKNAYYKSDATSLIDFSKNKINADSTGILI